MNTFHVITQIPMPGKAITRDSSFTALKGAKKWFLPVSVHGMGLTLMAKETGSGRETCVLTGMDLTTIWLEVRVDKFAAAIQLASVLTSKIADISPTHSCTSASQAYDCRMGPFLPMGSGTVHLGR